MELLQDGGTKVYIFGQVTQSRLPPCPYILKTEPGFTLTFSYHKVIFCPFVHFFVASGLCDMEVQSTSASLDCRGQGQRSVFYLCQYLQRTFSLTLLGKYQLNFICSLRAKGEMFKYLVQVTCPRLLPYPYMVKTFNKSHLLQNHCD